jgi:hypothetical protein
MEEEGLEERVIGSPCFLLPLSASCRSRPRLGTRACTRYAATGCTCVWLCFLLSVSTSALLARLLQQLQLLVAVWLSAAELRPLFPQILGVAGGAVSQGLAQ